MTASVYLYQVKVPIYTAQVAEDVATNYCFELLPYPTYSPTYLIF